MATAHPPLLPKPQQIQYGPARLPLRDLHIRLAGNPADEDRFAATELAAILSARSTTPIPIAESPDGPGPSLVLKRSGPVASLPMPGERPGPDSREAYRLQIADGNYPETRTKFKLRLQFSQGAKLTGTLTVLEPYGHISQIKNSRCDPDGCSFEVLNYGEEAEITSWRIWTENGELRGMRNFGPLRPFGLGAGARIFRIEGKRISSK